MASARTRPRLVRRVEQRALQFGDEPRELALDRGELVGDRHGAAGATERVETPVELADDRGGAMGEIGELGEGGGRHHARQRAPRVRVVASVRFVGAVGMV